MKTTKISFTLNILRNFLGMIILISMLASCDVLENDPDTLTPGTGVKQEVHVYSKNTSVIDLNTLIQTNQPVRLKITETTRRGELTNLGKGLLQYVPDSPGGKVRDSFVFAVFSENNNLLKTDSVIIVVENDSTQLPCAVIPLTDFVYNVPDNSATIIDVLANDILCNTDSAAITLTIFSPADTFPPRYGHAEVVNNRIVYHPGNNFNGSDQIMYRIETPTGAVAYGFVYITTTNTDICQFHLENDQYSINIDSLGGNSILLPVFQNDTICETFIAIDELHIYMEPHHGNASINANGVDYDPTDISPSTAAVDSIGYELCFDEVCYRAKAYLYLRKD